MLSWCDEGMNLVSNFLTQINDPNQLAGRGKEQSGVVRWMGYVVFPGQKVARERELDENFATQGNGTSGIRSPIGVILCCVPAHSGDQHEDQ
jgi:hypothetical protein